MKSLIGYFRNYRLQSILSPVFKLLEACFELAVPLIVAGIIDKGITGSDTEYIKSHIWLLVLFAVVRLFCQRRIFGHKTRFVRQALQAQSISV